MLCLLISSSKVSLKYRSSVFWILIYQFIVLWSIRYTTLLNIKKKCFNHNVGWLHLVYMVCRLFKMLTIIVFSQNTHITMYRFVGCKLLIITVYSTMPGTWKWISESMITSSYLPMTTTNRTNHVENMYIKFWQKWHSDFLSYSKIDIASHYNNYKFVNIY